jgi:hypothetical protein
MEVTAQQHVPSALPRVKNPSANWTGSSVGPKVRLGGYAYENLLSCRDSNPKPSRPCRVAIIYYKMLSVKHTHTLHCYTITVLQCSIYTLYPVLLSLSIQPPFAILSPDHHIILRFYRNFKVPIYVLITSNNIPS